MQIELITLNRKLTWLFYKGVYRDIYIIIQKFTILENSKILNI